MESRLWITYSRIPSWFCPLYTIIRVDLNTESLIFTFSSSVTVILSNKLSSFKKCVIKISFFD